MVRAHIRSRGSAMVETVVLMPIYIILIFGMLFLGYSTLVKQKEYAASSFAVWNEHSVGPQVLGNEFGMWASGSSDDIQEGPSGDVAAVGDGVLRIEEDEQTSDIYNSDDIAIRLFRMALAARSQYYVWEDGQLQERIELRGDDASRYLGNALGIYAHTSFSRTDPSGNYVVVDDLPSLERGNTFYEPLYHVSDLMAGTLDSGWSVKRTAILEYTYNPWFRPIAHSDTSRSLTTAQYLTLQFPERPKAPVYRAESRLMTRGDAHRSTIPDVSPGKLLDEMSALVGGDGNLLPEYMNEDDLGQLGLGSSGEWWVSR